MRVGSLCSGIGGLDLGLDFNFTSTRRMAK
jgi:hypothetical protein